MTYEYLKKKKISLSEGPVFLFLATQTNLLLLKQYTKNKKSQVIYNMGSGNPATLKRKIITYYVS